MASQAWEQRAGGGGRGGQASLPLGASSLGGGGCIRLPPGLPVAWGSVAVLSPPLASRSASPGPSAPDRPTSELPEQFEELPETEISFVSLSAPPPPVVCLPQWAVQTASAGWPFLSAGAVAPCPHRSWLAGTKQAPRI